MGRFTVPTLTVSTFVSAGEKRYNKGVERDLHVKRQAKQSGQHPNQRYYSNSGRQAAPTTLDKRGSSTALRSLGLLYGEHR